MGGVPFKEAHRIMTYQLEHGPAPWSRALTITLNPGLRSHPPRLHISITFYLQSSREPSAGSRSLVLSYLLTSLVF
jgi:hypothetical protein